MRHTGVWTMDTLHGRMFVQFVALCLYQYLDNELSRIKAELKEKTYSDGKDKPQTIQNEESKLLNWMDDRSVVRILNWFDAYDAVDISIKLKLKRWSDPVIKRDRLLLEKLGVINDD